MDKEIIAAILAAGIISKREDKDGDIAEAVGVYRAVLEEMEDQEQDDARSGPNPDNDIAQYGGQG